MQTNSQEMSHVMEASRGRIDLYVAIHKALRAFMTNTLIDLGRTDASDESDLEAMLQRVEHLLTRFESHLEHENSFMHPAIESRDPGRSNFVAADHGDHLMHMAQLRDTIQSVRATNSSMRAAELLALYRQFSLFVADNLVHMHVEETDLNASLWAHHSDAELQAIHGALVASIPPDEMMETMRWMVPQLPRTERAEMLKDMQNNAPAHVLEAVLNTVRPHLSTTDWHHLSKALGRMAEPGLTS